MSDEITKLPSAIRDALKVLEADAAPRPGPTAAALVGRIKRWREDDRAGYDQAIGLLCEAEEVLRGVADPPVAASCEHKNRAGGNDYMTCVDCGLMWDYRRESSADADAEHGFALTNPAPPGPYGTYYWVCGCWPLWAIRNGRACSRCSQVATPPETPRWSLIAWLQANATRLHHEKRGASAIPTWLNLVLERLGAPQVELPDHDDYEIQECYACGARVASPRPHPEEP